jgi:hypothetical protein
MLERWVMKIKLYYVVREYGDGAASIGKDSDAELISGPYHDHDSAASVVRAMPVPHEYTVVVSDLQVKKI